MEKLVIYKGIYTLKDDLAKDKYSKIKQNSNLEIRNGIIAKGNLVSNRNNKWLSLNGDAVYFKHLSDKKILNELIGAKITREFGLRTPVYKVSQYKEKLGVASFDFKVPGTYYFNNPEFEIVYDYKFAIDLIREMVNTKTEADNILKDLISLTVSDFYRGETDRHTYNICFEETKNMSLAPVFDFENSFEGSNAMHNDILSFDITDTSRTNELYKFIKKYPFMKEQLLKILNIDLNEILTSVEIEHNLEIHDSLKNSYLKQDSEKKQLVKTFLKQK